jgi:hypothetical protein
VNGGTLLPWLSLCLGIGALDGCADAFQGSVDLVVRGIEVVEDRLEGG